MTKLGAGSLFLDGSLSGNLQVLQGLLGGHGSILGNLLNAAIVSPGHSPGTLHVSGNYTQASTGLLKIEIGGARSGQSRSAGHRRRGQPRRRAPTGAPRSLQAQAQQAGDVPHGGGRSERHVLHRAE
ncbi:MAG: hypothetical protein WDN28_31490 [Chthoniobacter sp.]